MSNGLKRLLGMKIIPVSGCLGVDAVKLSIFYQLQRLPLEGTEKRHKDRLTTNLEFLN